jgi:polar amino acid transport system substrate-binding protein
MKLALILIWRTFIMRIDGTVTIVTIAILAVITLSFIGQSAAEDRMKLTLAVEDSWPPFSNELGDGYSKDIVSAAFKDTNIDVEFVVRPYARALREAKSGLVDGCFNVTRQQSTEAIYHFGEEPLLEAKASYFVLSGREQSSTILQAQSLADVPDDTRIAVIKGYEYGTVYEQHKARFQIMEVRTQSQVIGMLKKSHIDGAIMFERVAEATLKKMELPTDLLQAAFLNHTSGIYVAFNRENEKASYMAEALDTGLRRLKSSSAYMQIFEKYY